MRSTVDFTYQLERRLNFIIGVVLLLNLFLLTGIFSISYFPILITCFAVSLFYFIKRFERVVVVDLINNWNTILYIFLSLFLMLFQLLVADNKAVFKMNDCIRVIIYAIYFSWTTLLYTDIAKFKPFIFRFSLVCFVVLLIEGIIEISNPLFFSMLLSENVSKTILRVGGTFADANAFSNAVVILGFIILKFMPQIAEKKQMVLAVFVLTAMLYLVELSGSRQGILLLLVLCTYFMPGFFKKIGLKRMLIVGSILLVLSLLFLPFIYDYLLNNPDSSMARILFDDENPKSINSDLERSNAMTAGLNYIKNHFYLYGTGMFLFENEWAVHAKGPISYPHNSFVFLYCQYGIGALLIFYFLLIAVKRAITQQLWPLMLMLGIQLFLLSNTVYYPVHFFTLFVIDFCWIRQSMTLKKSYL